MIVFPQGQIYLTLPISAYSNKICNVTISSMSSKKSQKEQNMPFKAKLIPSSVQKITSSEDFNKKRNRIRCLMWLLYEILELLLRKIIDQCECMPRLPGPVMQRAFAQLLKHQIQIDKMRKTINKKLKLKLSSSRPKS